MRTFFARLSDPAMLPELPKLQARGRFSRGGRAGGMHQFCRAGVPAGSCRLPAIPSLSSATSLCLPAAPSLACRCHASRRRRCNVCCRRWRMRMPRASGWVGQRGAGDVVGYLDLRASVHHANPCSPPFCHFGRAPPSPPPPPPPTPHPPPIPFQCMRRCWTQAAGTTPPRWARRCGTRPRTCARCWASCEAAPGPTVQGPPRRTAATAAAVVCASPA